MRREAVRRRKKDVGFGGVRNIGDVVTSLDVGD